MTRQERSERTRRGLIQAAAEAFDANGFVRTRLSEISAGAGVSPGALHFHFENKAAVADAVERVARARLRCAARAALNQERGALQSLMDLSHAVAVLLTDDVVVRAGVRLNDDSDRPSGHDLHKDWQDLVEALLLRAAEEGTLDTEVPTRCLTLVLVAACTGLEALGRSNPVWLSRSSVTTLWTLLLPRMVGPSALHAVDPAGRDGVIRSAVPFPA
ncbi:ScbR family autoregulator-binding transcription factor [Streptomyces coeruleoprunus]|uniref:ScbR family autoregulator-binding transcription factor n=1 Tax=Streptomyces coeruleoprunus TaxID=285563 RepID=A0ABV9XME1_9ACTN